ncbi:anaphase-promoting complex subunit 4 [Phlebotomus argentipes]|uniref:anaphase-promoting complex subunit 4 n=1 Tax=Phlebotomus argentipes TaxID=94469 RepID=UPI00289339EA|nr:anaphase-promoting complex subunit 4 [Phlebotomus argentipes]
MSYSTSIKQIFSKNVRYKIDLMEWNNKMDLIALSQNNEVLIHRLNWQNIWTHPSPGDSSKVKGICWCPDEKIIAIGYSSGKVILLDVESKEEIFSFQLDGDIVSMCWTQQHIKPTSGSDPDITVEPDDDGVFLPRLPSLNNVSPTSKKREYVSRAEAKTSLNFLIVGLRTGFVHLSVFGMLPCGTVCLGKHIKGEFRVIDARVSSDFGFLHVTVATHEALHEMIFENSALPQLLDSLLRVATKHGQILTTMSYIEDVMMGIREAWETVLLEMDNKLTGYSNLCPKGSVSADFLELLVLGTPTPTLETFLRRELPEKGLKRLGNSIEMSYSTIQKLLVQPLDTAIMAICYHLNSVRGMSRDKYHFDGLLTEDVVTEACHKAGQFMMKAFELQQTIDQSTRDYKIFFRWLYVVIIQLMNERVPEDVASITQQEINYLAEFLSNLDDDEDGESITSERKFNLERVGQYLEDRDLIVLPKKGSLSQWEAFLDENPTLKDSETIYKHDRQASLVQVHNRLRQAVENVFRQPESIIGQNYKLRNVIQLAENMDNPVHCTHISLSDGSGDLFAFLVSENLLIFLEADKNHMIKCLRLEFQTKPYFDTKYGQFGDLSFRHLQFYSENILSLLLNNRTDAECGGCFVQMPVVILRQKATLVDVAEFIDVSAAGNVMNLYTLLDVNYVKVIEGSDWHTIAVSGNRKVTSILSENGKKIKIYETEAADEDEDEMDLSQSTNMDNSKESNQ